MEGFKKVSGRIAAMPGANIDTDVIMPKVFLKGINREGLSRGVFHDLRFDAEGALRPDFILNSPEMEGVKFLVVGPNFGCGSSREHAVWGLLQFGIRAIIGTSFAGIFADNAANNGLLLVTVTEPEAKRLTESAEAAPTDLLVDLEAQLLATHSLSLAFDIEPARRRSIMLGLDQIGETLVHADEIRSFQAAYFDQHPWLLEARTV